MYLPRNLIDLLYKQLESNRHAQSPNVLIFVALEPDALCACRILSTLLKRDFILHTIVPISGYADLERAGIEQVQPLRIQNGGEGGTVICLGVGGLVDLGAIFGFEPSEDGEDALGGVEVWLMDARRPWNLGNVFGGKPTDTALTERNGNSIRRTADVTFGQIQPHYKSGRGGIVVFDDGDCEELALEREAYFKLEQLPPIDDDGQESDESEPESEYGSETEVRTGVKRKSWSDADENDENADDKRPQQRRRSNSSESLPVTPTRSSVPPRSAQAKEPSTRRNRRRLLRLKRKHEAVLHNYYNSGNSYSEPISSLVYSLASQLGMESNDFLWLAIVGVSSMELYGRSVTGVGVTPSGAGPNVWGGQRGERITQVLRDEVRRLNPPDPEDLRNGTEATGIMPTTARSSTDNSIKLSPEPRFLLVRHWSLYDSMLHSPYLAARLHVWTEKGKRRLNKLLATMGISIQQCKQNYTHMELDLKRGLREKLLKYAPIYGLEGLVPPDLTAGRGREGWGFVRSWGWKACLSAVDVGVIVGAMLEVKQGVVHSQNNNNNRNEEVIVVDEEGIVEAEEYVRRFWHAYDALEDPLTLIAALPPTLHLHRAILRTGTSLFSKGLLRNLRGFWMAVVKDGPDVQLFTHAGALTKLALWMGEAIAEQEREKGRASGKKGIPLVLAGLNESRGVYVVVGTGGGGGVVDFAARRERQQRKEEKEKKKAERVAAKAAEKEKRRQEKAEKSDAADDAAESEAEEETEDEDDDDDDDDDDENEGTKGSLGRNRFGNAFQEVVDETNARVRIDSFEHCVVEVKKDDLSAFLETLSMKVVVG